DDDVNDFLAVVDSAVMVVTDHYAIDREWQSKVRAALGCKIVAIDDLVREHDADLIIDQTLGRASQEYQSSDKVLAGTNYAILRPEFAELRERAFDRSVSKSLGKILVTMGGSDTPNATMAVLRALSSQSDITITVLLSDRAEHYSEVASYCAGYPQIQHIDFVEDMATLMMEHDVAIGAPGTTSWERACLGLPSIVVPIAQNQQDICKQLVSNHVSIAVPLAEVEQSLPSALNRMLLDWESYYSASLKTCDGLGIRRILLIFDQFFALQRPEYELVQASVQDIEKVFQWQCHPSTRQFSLNQDQPTWDEHLDWMTHKISECVQDHFYITRDIETKTRIGVARLDRISAGHYLVSIFIDPESYGKGIGLATLELLDNMHPHVTIHATVLADNVASQRLFEKANYQRVDAKNFIRNPVGRDTYDKVH
ncbi:MAG: UDP-2,4-diacetamido-2,4,6-trideoxy-beta-L-altropyranose hydrolase, partial [Proteobacteria bacterium]|nr:UDP-2,4-diacetamido-2,4,6-trideoxy-beta-L-altropyranose hydrolase [Pseudomonadota bacterium]